MTTGKAETPNKRLLRLFDEAEEWPTVRQAIRDVVLPEQAEPLVDRLEVLEREIASLKANVRDHEQAIGRLGGFPDETQVTR